MHKIIIFLSILTSGLSASAMEVVLDDVIIKTYSQEESKEICMAEAKKLVHRFNRDYFKIENYRCDSRSSQLSLIADFKIGNHLDVQVTDLTKPLIISEFNSNFYHAPTYSAAMNYCLDDIVYYHSFTTGEITLKAECAYSRDNRNNPQEWNNPTIQIEIIFKNP